MTNEQKQVKDWMVAFGQEAPERPCIPDISIRKLRAKLNLTECLELLVKSLGVELLTRNDDSTDSIDLRKLLNDLEAGKYGYNAGGTLSLKEITDGCSDLSVVNYGTLVACGLAQANEGLAGYEGEDALFNEVMRSNWTKLWTREEIEQDWPEAKGLDDVTGSWYKPGVDSRHITKVGDRYLVKDKDGKVIKSPSYSPANLQPIIESL